MSTHLVSLSKFAKDRMALVGLCIVLAVILVAACAPWISPYDPREMVWGQEWKPPGNSFLMGTDRLGRDILSRMIWGARTSLMVGILTALLVTVVGCTMGLVAGYFRGKVEEIIMRTADMIMLFPSLPLLIVVASALESRNIITIIVLMGLFDWPSMARITISKVLTVKEQLYVEVARGLGVSDTHIILRHILPNSLSPILVYAFMFVTSAILTESTLSFLGLGDPSTISWGFMLAEGRAEIGRAWWIATFPGIAISITLLGFNLLGDGLRDMLDVRLR